MLESLENEEMITWIFEILDYLEAPPVKVLLALRVDRLLKSREILRRLLPGLAERGRAIHIYVMGLENFCDEELLRLNKGFTGSQVIEAINALQELEQAYPQSFHYSSYRLFSVILFTPWTTLEMLHHNLRQIRRLQLEDKIGNTFLSRLRLHPDLAITALARSEGLLMASPDDQARILSQQKLFGEELPWRYRDPRMELIDRLALRIGGLDYLKKDRLYQEIESRKAGCRRPGGWNAKSLLALFTCLVEAGLSFEGPFTEEGLLEATFESWNRGQADRVS